MKKSILFAFTLLSIALFSNFTTPQNEIHRVLQIAFETEGFQEFIEEKTADAPLVIVTNQLIPNDFELEYDSRNIIIVESVESLNKKPQQPILELIDFELKKKKSIVQFQYGEYKISIKLKKGAHQWASSYSYVRGNGYLNLAF
ncbi:MAG: hypothetical protein AAF599_18545 [Bacteroidota bacterium]